MTVHGRAQDTATLRILVVDRYTLEAEAAREALAAHGHEALARPELDNYALELAGGVDVVLLASTWGQDDRGRAVARTVAAARRLRRHHPTLPIVLHGQDDEQTGELWLRAVPAFAVSAVSKTAEPDVLMDALHRAHD